MCHPMLLKGGNKAFFLVPMLCVGTKETGSPARYAYIIFFQFPYRMSSGSYRASSA